MAPASSSLSGGARSRSPRRGVQAQGHLPDYAASEKPSARKSVYLVTASHPKQERSACGVRLVAPETLSRQQVLDAVLDIMKHPVYTDAKSKAAAAKGKGGTALLHAGVFQEAHKAGEDGVVHQHVHIIIRAATAFRFGPVKTALLRRHGLAVHFGCTHAGYFSAVR